MKKKGNKFFTLLVICGILLFSVIAFVVIKSTRTVSAVVPNQLIAAGTNVDETMLKTIQVPVNTPKGYLTDKSTILGQKIKVTVQEDQLLYSNDIMSSWDDLSDGESIPDDYVVTSIQIPANRAVGGLITAGDTVDILGIPNANYNTTSKETLNNYLGEISKNYYGAEGMNLYWVLSNVRILETDSSLSSSNDSAISAVTDENSGSSSQGDFYIVALSYDDYQKVRLAEQYLDLWLSITPEYNAENGPMLDIMNSHIIKELQDSQTQSVIKESETNTDLKPENKNNKNDKGSNNELKEKEVKENGSENAENKEKLNE